MGIKIKNLTYKGIIEKLTINFKENEITSIIGKNGSGKTEILNLMYCLHSPNSGQLYVDNVKIDKKTSKKEIKSIKKDVVYLNENYLTQLFNINILEDLKYGLNGKINKENLEVLMKSFGLSEEILKKNYLEISDSEKKRVCLIKVFLSDAKILLLDNPNSGLDNKYTQSLVKILKKLRRSDKIIILTSQNPEFILQVSDRVVVVDDKTIILDGEKYDVMSNKKILNKINMDIPKVINFSDKVLKNKKIKLGYRDNINDLIKDIYRNAK